MRKTDYLIIGAGIVGCSAAYLLTKDGKKVTIVDKSYHVTKLLELMLRNGTPPAASKISANACTGSTVMG